MITHLLARLLFALLPVEYRHSVRDDLAEEREWRCAREGVRAADVWYGRELWRSMVPALRLRARLRGAVRVAVARLPKSTWDRSAGEMGQAIRRLRRTPGFTCAAVLTLAVGIGANAAIFSLIDGVLLRRLPYADSGRLVALRHHAPGIGLQETNLSDGTYLHYREGNRVFEEMAIWQTASVNLTAETEPERVDLVLATPSFFRLLGVRPAVGSGFGAEARGGTSVILSHGLWQRRYGGDPSIVGRTIEVNGVPRLVAGVMPRDFRFPHPRIDLWMDLGVRFDEARVGGYIYQAAARLSDGVTIEQAQADLRGLLPSLEGRFEDATAEALARARLDVVVLPLKDLVVRDVRSTLWLLFGTVWFVLLIAAVNVTTLHLVRASAREREVVVRAALGAGRADMIRHFMSESLVLAGAGGAAGLLIAWLAVRMVLATSLVSLPRLEEVGIDGRVAGFVVVLSLFSAVVVGVIPALRASRAAIGEGLRASGRAFTGGRERQRTQRLLVAVQVAIALTLLVGSALMVQTFLRIRDADPGFDARDLLTLEVILPYRGYETYEASARFQFALLERIRALPGVESAGAIGGLPMTASEFPELPGAAEVASGDARGAAVIQSNVHFRMVTDDYFETMRTPLTAGRAPRYSDRSSGGRPVLISAGLAARLFPDGGAVGQRIRRHIRNRTPEERDSWSTVLGVVADVYHDGIGRPAQDIVYVPVLDAPSDMRLTAGFLAYAMRTRESSLALVPRIRDIVRELDPALPIASVRTMESIVDSANARTTFMTLLLLVAAMSALFLGVIGIHGVLSYAVGLRRREIGLRMALGAREGEVVRFILRDGMLMTLMGLGMGVVAAAVLTRFLRGVLYGVSSTDPATFAGTVVLLLAVAALASTLPARRAARIRPAEALADG